MAGRGKEPGLGIVRRFGLLLGDGKLRVQLLKRMRALRHARFQPLVGILKRPFGIPAFGNVVIDTEITQNLAGFVKVRDICPLGIAVLAFAALIPFAAITRPPAFLGGGKVDLEALAITFKHRADHRFQPDIALLPHRFAHGHAMRLDPADAKHPLIRAVGKTQPLIFVGIGDHDRNIVGIDADIALAFAQCFLGPDTCGNVGNGRDKPAIGHRVGPHFKHHAIRSLALVSMGQSSHLRGGIAPQKDIDIDRTRPIVTTDIDQFRKRHRDLNIACGDAQKIDKAMVPCRQTQILVKHPDPLRNVFQRIEQKIPVEFDRLGRFIQKLHRIAPRYRLVGQQKRHHHAR